MIMSDGSINKTASINENSQKCCHAHMLGGAYETPAGCSGKELYCSQCPSHTDTGMHGSDCECGLVAILRVQSVVYFHIILASYFNWFMIIKV